MKYPEKYFSVFGAYGYSNFSEGNITLQELKEHCMFDKSTYDYNVLIGYEYSEENKKIEIVYYMPRKERMEKVNVKINSVDELCTAYELIKKYYSFIREKEIKELNEYLEGGAIE